MWGRTMEAASGWIVQTLQVFVKVVKTVGVSDSWLTALHLETNGILFEHDHVRNVWIGIDEFKCPHRSLFSYGRVEANDVFSSEFGVQLRLQHLGATAPVQSRIRQLVIDHDLTSVHDCLKLKFSSHFDQELSLASQVQNGRIHRSRPRMIDFPGTTSGNQPPWDLTATWHIAWQ